MELTFVNNVQHSILFSVVTFKFKFPVHSFCCIYSFLYYTERLCVTLWREAGLGGPGEETVLLDTDDPGHQHPHLLLVEATQHCHLFTAGSSVKISYHI